jgi:hypothetical protein
MLIPVLATAVMFIFFDKKKVAWWEYLLLFGASAIVIFVSKLIIETSMTSDTEYWSEVAYEVEYEGKYDEYIHKTCTERYACGTDSKGQTKYCTRTYDCSYVEHHSPKWRIKGKDGSSIRITQSEYNRIKQKWGNEKKTGTHSRAYTYDDGIYGSFWLNRRELIECMVTKHTYENRVQAAHTVFDFQEVTEEDKKSYGLYDYPQIYENYKQKHILGANDPKAEKNMQILNAELGPKKQVKAFILIFRNKSKQAGIMQEAYWQGGNKNEFVLTIGVDKNNNVQWTYPFTWAEHSIVKVDAREFVLAQDKLDLVEISDFLYDNLNEKFVRKQFSEFKYLTVEPSMSSIIWSMVILIIITTGLVWWFVANEFDDELMNKGRRIKYRY